MDICKKKNVVIFGGSGFLAQALIPRLQSANSILCVARNEGNLIEVQQKYGVDILPGDIADEWIAKKAMAGMQIVMDLSAFKHVGLAENEVHQTVRSNVLGTVTLLQETMRVLPEAFVFISTDKAARVSGVYGATKLLGERLVQETALVNPKTQYRVVRYGNILYSTGSVLCKWKDKLQKGEEVIITEPEATRFYWTVDQAVDLIFDSLENGKDAVPHHSSMKALRLGDLLVAMCDKYANGTPKVKVIGLQKGENMHEIIEDNGADSSQVARYTYEEILDLI